MQLLAHGIGEYMCDTYDRNDLANLGIIIGYDSRYESLGLCQIMAAVFKAYSIRVFCLDRHAIAPFIAYFAYKFKCLLGVMVTGRDLPKEYNGAILFNNRGHLISAEVSSGIEKCMIDYIKQQYY